MAQLTKLNGKINCKCLCQINHLKMEMDMTNLQKETTGMTYHIQGSAYFSYVQKAEPQTEECVVSHQLFLSADLFEFNLNFGYVQSIRGIKICLLFPTDFNIVSPVLQYMGLTLNVSVIECVCHLNVYLSQ